MKIRIWMVGALVLVLALFAFFYLFRRKTMEVPGLGKVTLVWRWGRAAEADVDRNEDGQVDLRLIYRTWESTFHTHRPIDEAWESSVCSGRLDRHMVVRNGALKILNYDSDSDGSLDKTLLGDAAIEFLRRNPVPESCGWRLDFYEPPTHPLPQNFNGGEGGSDVEKQGTVAFESPASLWHRCLPCEAQL